MPIIFDHEAAEALPAIGEGWREVGDGEPSRGEGQRGLQPRGAEAEEKEGRETPPAVPGGQAPNEKPKGC